MPSGASLHKLLNKRLRVPNRIVHPLMSSVRIAASPAQYRMRRRVAEELMASRSSPLTVDRDHGCRRFEPHELPGSQETAERCRHIFESSQVADANERFLRNPKKRFLLSVLAGSDACRYPELIRFAVSHPLLDAASTYLGSIPVLAAVNLWWSPVNATARSSQLFHVDTEDSTQLKVFINVTDTTHDHGPLNFMSAERSRRVRARVGFDARRIEDEQLAADGGEEVSQLVGPAGSGAFVDTSRCLHFGSRGNREERVMLMIQFLRFQSPCEATFRFHATPAINGLDPAQRLALGIKATR